MGTTIGAIIAIAVTLGLVAGCIGYTRMGNSTSAFVGFFLLGCLIPLLGIVAAAMAQRPVEAPQPPGWYPDPWGHASQRWWDGYQWTYHLNGPPQQPGLRSA